MGNGPFRGALVGLAVSFIIWVMIALVVWGLFW